MDKQAMVEAREYHRRREARQAALREQRRRDRYGRVRSAILNVAPR
jgi:hypothetical protein